MPKGPDNKDLSEFTGVIELKPNQFERVSPAIREAKSYLALAGQHAGPFFRQERACAHRLCPIRYWSFERKFINRRGTSHKLKPWKQQPDLTY